MDQPARHLAFEEAAAPNRVMLAGTAFPHLFKAKDFAPPPRGFLSLPERIMRRLTGGSPPVRPRTIDRNIILRNCVPEIQALLDRDPADLSEFVDLGAVNGCLTSVQQGPISDDLQIWLICMVNVSLLAGLRAEGLIDRVLHTEDRGRANVASPIKRSA